MNSDAFHRGAVEETTLPAFPSFFRVETSDDPVAADEEEVNVAEVRAFSSLSKASNSSLLVS